MSLKTIFSKIAPHANFICVHKQYVVQAKCIESVDSGQNILKVGENVIPIGRKFKKDLLERIELL